MPRGGARKGAGRPRGQGRYGESTRAIRVPGSMVSAILRWAGTRSHDVHGYSIPLFATSVSAGFPSPADDYVEKKLDLNEHIVKRPAATFFVRVSGDSMIDAGIHEGDLLVVDRSLPAVHGKIVIAVVDGELTVKRLYKENGKVMLLAENDAYPALCPSNESDVSIWGVVTYVLHKT